MKQNHADISKFIIVLLLVLGGLAAFWVLSPQKSERPDSVQPASVPQGKVRRQPMSVPQGKTTQPIPETPQNLAAKHVAPTGTTAEIKSKPITPVSSFESDAWRNFENHVLLRNTLSFEAEDLRKNITALEAVDVSRMTDKERQNHAKLLDYLRQRLTFTELRIRLQTIERTPENCEKYGIPTDKAEYRKALVDMWGIYKKLGESDYSAVLEAERIALMRIICKELGDTNGAIQRELRAGIATRAPDRKQGVEKASGYLSWYSVVREYEICGESLYRKIVMRPDAKLREHIATHTMDTLAEAAQYVEDSRKELGEAAQPLTDALSAKISRAAEICRPDFDWKGLSAEARSELHIELHTLEAEMVSVKRAIARDRLNHYAASLTDDAGLATELSDAFNLLSSLGQEDYYPHTPSLPKTDNRPQPPASTPPARRPQQ